jgi:indolepyruvate ferredoxin oxidoreductase alpha subunit
VLIVEEGFPDYVEQSVNTELRRADIQTRIHGKGALPKAGEYTGEVVLRGLANFLCRRQARRHRHGGDLREGRQAARPQGCGHRGGRRASAAPAEFLHRLSRASGVRRAQARAARLGPTHISADIGCHSFATFAPFSMGNSILGYGMSLASAAAVAPNMSRRPISVMGDGGFWHNGLITGVASNLFNKNDGVLIVMQNGYTSATGSNTCRRA